MKAIKVGEKGEDKVKKYDPFDSEVPSANGKLDVSALANPTAPAGTGLNEPPAPIKTIKKESASPPPVDVATSPQDLVTPPSSILGDVKLYQGSPSSDILSPQSDASDCPPNVVSQQYVYIVTTYTQRVHVCVVKVATLGSFLQCDPLCYLHG